MPSKEETKKDIKTYRSIVALSELEGGKLLVKNLKKDVLTDLENVLSLYKGEEMELRSAVVKLKADLGLLRVFLKAPKNLKYALQALEEAEKEENE